MRVVEFSLSFADASAFVPRAQLIIMSITNVDMHSAQITFIAISFAGLLLI
jgi:hypothetical protein